MCKQNKVWSFKFLDFKTCYRRGVVSRWWRNWTGKLPSPLQIYQKITCMWNNSHSTSSEPWERTPGVQKGKPIYLEWGRAKDKDKKGDKGSWESILRRGSWRRRSFQATRNPLTSGVIGELGNLRWKHNNAKQRKLCTEVVPNCNFQPKRSSHTPLGAEALAVGLGPQGKDWGWTLWRYSKGVNVTQHSRTGETLGPLEKVHFCGKALRQHSNSACTQNKEQNHGEYLGGENRLQFVAAEAEKQAHNCQRQKAKDHYNLGPMDPWITSTAKLWVAADHYPHLPGTLSGSDLPASRVITQGQLPWGNTQLT